MDNGILLTLLPYPNISPPFEVEGVNCNIISYDFPSLTEMGDCITIHHLQ